MLEWFAGLHLLARYALAVLIGTTVAWPFPGWPGIVVCAVVVAVVFLALDKGMREDTAWLVERIVNRREYDQDLVLDEDGNLHHPPILVGEQLHAHGHEDGSTCIAVLDRHGLPRKTLHVPADHPAGPLGPEILDG